MSLNKSQDFFIQWHLTERCNLRCSHCYQTGAGSSELTLDEISGVADEAADMLAAWSENYGLSFDASYTITGGEPFLRRDLFEILEAIKGRDFGLYLLTNGTLITEEKAKRLWRAGIKGVQISIEGPEEIHEGIRGQGSFAAALRGVRHLLQNGIPVTLNVTLSELNADYFMDLVSLAATLGVQRLGFSRLVPSGSGAALLDQMLTKEKTGRIYEQIFSLQIEGLEIVTGDPMASQMTSPDDVMDEVAVPTGGCAAGFSGLTLLPDGTIVPCRRLCIPIGNVRTHGLREVWSTSPVLEALRDKTQYGGKCGICAHWSTCRGCRAIAYAYSQAQGIDDFLSEDPQCFIGDTVHRP